VRVPRCDWSRGIQSGQQRGPGLLPGAALFVLAGCLAMTVADPLTLIVIGADIAAVNFAVLSFHTLRLNRALLPEALRPPRWREAVVAVGHRLRGAGAPRDGGPARAAARVGPLSYTPPTARPFTSTSFRSASASMRSAGSPATAIRSAAQREPRGRSPRPGPGSPPR